MCADTTLGFIIFISLINVPPLYNLSTQHNLVRRYNEVVLFKVNKDRSMR